MILSLSEFKVFVDEKICDTSEHILTLRDELKRKQATEFVSKSKISSLGIEIDQDLDSFIDIQNLLKIKDEIASHKEMLDLYIAIDGRLRDDYNASDFILPEQVSYISQLLRYPEKESIFMMFLVQLYDSLRESEEEFSFILDRLIVSAT